MARIKLGPLNLDIYDIETILKRIEDFITTRTPSQIVTLNSLMFNLALRDPDFCEAASRAALVITDSSGIKWAASYLSGFKTERIAGIDLLGLICKRASEKGYGIFLLGAKPGVAESAAANLSQRYAGLKVSGTHHGYFGRDEDDRVIGLIAGKKPDVLFVGFDMPMQELWISRNLSRLDVPVVMGVGGSFDVLSGRLKRAPVLMRDLHLEWLFRSFQQPWRIKRIIGLPAFVFNIFRTGNKGSALSQ